MADTPTPPERRRLTDAEQIEAFLERAQSIGVAIDPQRWKPDNRWHSHSRDGAPDGTSYRAYFNSAGLLVGNIRNHRSEEAIAFSGRELFGSQPRAAAPQRASVPATPAPERVPDARVVSRMEAAWASAQQVETIPEPHRYAGLPAAGYRVNARGNIVVPVGRLRADGQVEWTGGQFVNADGSKIHMEGIIKQGAFAVVPLSSGDGDRAEAVRAALSAPELAICEGIGTALAFHRATGLPALAAFDAGNLLSVSRSLAPHYAGQLIYVMDRDPPRDVAERKGTGMNGQIDALAAGLYHPNADYLIFGEPGEKVDARDVSPETVRDVLAHGRLKRPDARAHFVLHATAEAIQRLQEKEQAMQANEQQQSPPSPEAAQSAESREARAEPAQVAAPEAGESAAPAGDGRPQPSEAQPSGTEKGAAAAPVLENAMPGSSRRQTWQEHLPEIERAREARAAELRAQGLPEVIVNSLAAHEAARQLEALDAGLSRGAQAADIDPDAPAMTGKRVGDMSPLSLEGLETKIVKEPPAVHYRRAEQDVFVDVGYRVDVLAVQSDREIEAALRLSAQKFDLEKGLLLTGSAEFKERAARIAGRLGYKIQNAELQAAWERGSNPAEISGVASSLDVRSPAVKLPTDPAMRAESAAAKLAPAELEALAKVAAGETVEAAQRDALEREGLVQANGGALTEAGKLAAAAEHERTQQALRTRNVDAELVQADDHKAAERAAGELAVELQMQREGAPVLGPRAARVDLAEDLGR